MPPTAFCSPSPDAFLSAERHLGVSAVVKVPVIASSACYLHIIAPEQSGFAYLCTCPELPWCWLQVSQGWLFPMAAAFCFLERVREPVNNSNLTLHGRPQCPHHIATWVPDHLATGCCQGPAYGSTAKPQRPVQPALLLPLDDIGSVEFARAAGTSSTFDLLLHALDGSTHEARAWHSFTLFSLPRVW